MKRLPVTIAWGPVVVYLFALGLVQLGRMHIGLLFDFGFFFMLLLPLLSLAHLLHATLSLKYHQEFDTDHPVKGERLTYTLSLANESVFASARIRISFTTVQPGTPLVIDDLDLSLKRGERLDRAYPIMCPFRGIYTVGLDALILEDLLGWISIFRPVWHRTFYVYPRILDLAYPFAVGDVSDLSTGPNPGASEDYSLFESLVSYRYGQSTRHIAWKKFFALGEPYLKSYARTSQPGITIYFDLRRNEEPTPMVLEREDCSIEILVSLVRHFLEREVPVTVHAFGQSRYRFAAESQDAFGLFHADTVNLIFVPTVSPAEMYRADALSIMPRSSVLFITHRMDPAIVEIVEESVESPAADSAEVACIVNQTGMTGNERIQTNAVFDRLIERGAKALVVSGPATLVSDMERVS